MKKNLKWRTVVIVVTILLCIFGIIGLPKSKAELVQNLKDNIRLGLDLKGGSQLVLEVQVQDAVKADADQTIERMKEDMKKQNISFNSMDRNDPQPASVADADNIIITVKGVPADQSSAFRSLVNDRYPTYVLTAVNSTDYTMRLKPSDLIALKRDTVQRTIDTIDNRINQLGVAESSVQQYGRAGADYEILVQLPGVDDPARVKELIGTAAVLEIDEVKEGPFPSREAALAQTRRRAAAEQQAGQGQTARPARGRRMVPAGPAAGDHGQRDAQRACRPGRIPQVGNQLYAFAGWRAAVSARSPRRISATSWRWCWTTRSSAWPPFSRRIEDSGRITGLGSEEEAEDLARYLRSGSLPASVKYLEESSVGPSLGADSIHEGITAGVAGLIAVVVVMLVYYKRSGVNAVLALLLNTVILLAAISYFHAALTLPGIAGVILTIGMAVDSNVLIFESIREELRAGKAVVAAVDTGSTRRGGRLSTPTSPRWYPAPSCFCSGKVR